MENRENKGSKVMSIFQKLYNCRLRIDKKGKTILNWSSLFSLACLILAPHMSIAGIILSLILGYHISLETDQDDAEFEQRVRQAADTVKKTATAAAKTIRDEVEKNRTIKEPERKTELEQKAEPKKVEEAPVKEAPVNQEVVEELERQAKEFQANPASYRSVYSAVAGSVPILEVHEEENEAKGNTEQNYRQMGQ